MDNLPRFVIFDGADGVGKSTQLNVFADFLRKECGKNVKVIKALGGDGTDFVTAELRKLLLSPQFPNDDYESEERLFAVAHTRAVQQAQRFLAENENNVVLMDRGIASDIVYNLAKGIQPNWLSDIMGKPFSEYNRTADTYGGLNVILVPEDEKMAMDRVAARGEPVVARLENLTMQRNVIKYMRDFGSNDDQARGYVDQFIGTGFQTVVVEVKREENIKMVGDKVFNAIVSVLEESHRVSGAV